ncbi:YbgC/FadM family acyl-CoA thioesterase [Caenispirillum bisanense]|uniref:Acyl-CoA thioester hydrolase n=1 Tax=Caenispirillum bisanense TaxID=414052 RepID=A0A286GQ36_9PROT|nr:YbgC/FadM family acyl-CoA thioesterase [Caenispirillum bisanense]SOD97622.1 acyl-CoA thioester hydrolase [Caenispirillum bisanense]
MSGSATAPVPAQGVVRDGVHVFPVRIYYEDTDAGGIVYHARYLHFTERARSELMRLCGYDNRDLMKDPGIAFAVRKATCDFRRPAVLDDLLEVHTTVGKVGGASFEAVHEIKRDGEILVRIDIKLASMALAGGVARLPDAVKHRLAGLLSGD